MPLPARREQTPVCRGVLEGVAWRQGEAHQGAEFACPAVRRGRSWGFETCHSEGALFATEESLTFPVRDLSLSLRVTCLKIFRKNLV